MGRRARLIRQNGTVVHDDHFNLPDWIEDGKQQSAPWFVGQIAREKPLNQAQHWELSSDGTDTAWVGEGKPVLQQFAVIESFDVKIKVKP